MEPWVGQRPAADPRAGPARRLRRSPGETGPGAALRDRDDRVDQAADAVPARDPARGARPPGEAAARRGLFVHRHRQDPPRDGVRGRHAALRRRAAPGPLGRPERRAAGAGLRRHRAALAVEGPGVRRAAAGGPLLGGQPLRRGDPGEADPRGGLEPAGPRPDRERRSLRPHGAVASAPGGDRRSPPRPREGPSHAHRRVREGAWRPTASDPGPHRDARTIEPPRSQREPQAGGFVRPRPDRSQGCGSRRGARLVPEGRLPLGDPASGPRGPVAGGADPRQAQEDRRDGPDRLPRLHAGVPRGRRRGLHTEPIDPPGDHEARRPAGGTCSCSAATWPRRSF